LIEFKLYQASVTRSQQRQPPESVLAISDEFARRRCWTSPETELRYDS
jgi:hypothetical protein